MAARSLYSLILFTLLLLGGHPFPVLVQLRQRLPAAVRQESNPALQERIWRSRPLQVRQPRCTFLNYPDLFAACLLLMGFDPRLSVMIARPNTASPTLKVM